MSKVVKTAKKAFKKIRENKIGRMILIGAAIYFAASAASGAFATPTPGLGTTLGETGFTGATEALGGDIAVGGVGETLAADVAGTIGAPVAEVAGTTGMGAGGVDLSLAGGGGTAATQTALTAATGAPAVAEPGLVKGAMNLMQENPMATMMLGQGLSGAAQAKSEEEMQREAAAERRSRGLFGVDYSGAYKGAGQPRQGIVSSQVGAVQPTSVAGQTVGEQAIRPIQKKNYPQLSKQNLIAPGV